jgi:hypothetical protein
LAGFRIIYKHSYQGAASGVEIADLSEQHEFTPGFRGMRVAQTWIFSVVFCKNKLVDITPHSHPAIRTLDIVF